MKTAYMLLTAALLTSLLLFPSTALAAPPDGTRLQYYSTSARTIEVGRRYYCFNVWYKVGTMTSYIYNDFEDNHCNEIGTWWPGK